jgi:hypothetical protein
LAAGISGLDQLHRLRAMGQKVRVFVPLHGNSLAAAHESHGGGVDDAEGLAAEDAEEAAAGAPSPMPSAWSATWRSTWE